MRTTFVAGGLLMVIAGMAGGGEAVDWRHCIHRLELPKALPSDRTLNLCLQARDGKYVGGMGKALAFNKAAHDVDASGLAVDGAGIRGQVLVTINPDHYQPPGGKPVLAVYSIDAKIEGPKITGTFQGRYNVARPDGGAATGLDKLAEKPLAGIITGSLAPPLTTAGLVVLDLHLEDARGEKIEDRNPWGNRGFASILFKDGKPIQGLFHGHGGRQVNYLEAAVTDMTGLRWEPASFSGPLAIRSSAGENYVYTFAGRIVGDQVGGTFQKVLDGKTVPGSQFQGAFSLVPDAAVLGPADAIHRWELHGAVDGTKQLLVFARCRGGKFIVGLAYSGTFNHNYHDVDASGLVLEGNRVRGTLNVTINPDEYMPADKKPIPCRYEVDMLFTDGHLAGQYSGTFGPRQASGKALGRLEAAPAVPKRARVSVKLEDGVCEGVPWFRRTYVSFAFEQGKPAAEGGMSNNKRGWEGTFKSATAKFDGLNFEATIHGTVDKTSGPRKGAYTFHLKGRAVGSELIGTVDTELGGQIVKRGTTFMGAIHEAD